MRVIIEVEIAGDFDEDALTVDEKMDVVEAVLDSGAESCCFDIQYLKFLEIKEND